LPALYRGAQVLAHPAVDEGFGMTVVESMAAGTPVVAARAGALPEVSGDAALLVPPDQPDAWVQALRSVITDAGLAGDLRARGRRRAAQFGVTAMASATMRVYADVLDAPDGRPSAPGPSA
jgi:glycosyltransferase involved in cell wall biosynthesis